MSRQMAADSYGQWEELAKGRDQLVSSNWFNSINAHLQAQQLANQVEQARLNRNLQAYLQGMSMAQENKLNDANQAMNFAKLQASLQDSAANRDLQAQQLGLEQSKVDGALQQFQANLQAAKEAQQRQDRSDSLQALRDAVNLTQTGFSPDAVSNAFGVKPEHAPLLGEAFQQTQAARAAQAKRSQMSADLANMGLEYQDPNSERSKKLAAATPWWWWDSKDAPTLKAEKDNAIKYLNALNGSTSAQNGIMYDSTTGKYQTILPFKWTYPQP